MGLVAGKRDELPLVEDGHDHAHVGHVGAAPQEGVVDDIYITGMEVLLPMLLHHGADHGGDHADEASDAVALGQQAAVGVRDAAGIVQGLIDDRTHGRLRKGVENLVADRDQGVLHDIQGHWIDLYLFSHHSASVSTMRLP